MIQLQPRTKHRSPAPLLWFLGVVLILSGLAAAKVVREDASIPGSFAEATWRRL